MLSLAFHLYGILVCLRFLRYFGLFITLGFVIIIYKMRFIYLFIFYWEQYHELAAEAFYLMAIVFDKLGKPEDREEAAASFKKHVMALENPEDEDPLLSLL